MGPVEGQGIRIEDLPNELVITTFSYLKIQDLINCSQVSKRFRENVAGELRRRKEDLLNVIQDLQCFKCKKVPRPDLSKRYLCKNSSHSLCEKHKESRESRWHNLENKCPCGSLVYKTPSKSIATKLQNLPWICQNYKRGCHEVKMDVNNLKIHQEKCIFRKVFCPLCKIQRCHNRRSCRNSSCWGTRVCFKDIFDHFNTNHTLVWNQIDGESNKWTLDPFDPFDPNNIVKGCRWYSGKMTSNNGDVFALVAKPSWSSSIISIINGFYTWIWFFGSTEEARNYSCRISIKNKFGHEFIYSGPVHAIDKSEKAIVNSGLLLAKNLTRDGENDFKIEVTIQNLKSEAISTESQDFYQTNSDLSLDSDCSLDSDSSLDSNGHQN